MIEYINDSMANGNINTPRSRQSFKYLTENNIFEIPDDLGQPHQGAIFFLYKKSLNSYYITLKLVPLKKGTYLVQFLNSGFRDAICYNRINHTIKGYRNTDFTYLLDEAVGRVIGGPDDYYPFNYVLKVE